MQIICNRHINLHTTSTRSGLVHVEPDTKPQIVPSDVDQHPGFQMLVDGGVIAVVNLPDPEPWSEPVEKTPVPRSIPRALKTGKKHPKDSEKAA